MFYAQFLWKTYFPSVESESERSGAWGRPWVTEEVRSLKG